MSGPSAIPALILELRASGSLALEAGRGGDAELLRRAADALELAEVGMVSDHPALDVLAERLEAAADLARVNRWPAIESYLAESARVFRRSSALRPALLHERRGYPMILASGKPLDVTTCRVEQIELEDVATGLGHLCRFGGQVQWFYSVAEHSVRVARLLPREIALWGLLHDGSEAYLGDVIGPHKGSSAFDGYRGLEARLQPLVFERFGLRGPVPAEVDAADRLMLRRELVDLGKVPVAGSDVDAVAPIECWSSERAIAEFASLFTELAGVELAYGQGKA